MSFQGYVDTIESKTGKSIDRIVAEAGEQGFVGGDVKAADVVAWADTTYGLGRGHAMAIVKLIKERAEDAPSRSDKIDALFSGGRAHWRPLFDQILGRLDEEGLSIKLMPTDSYVSLLKGKAKIGIVHPVAGHLDIGIKLKGVETTERFAAAGSWNSMVTHRVVINDPSEFDDEVVEWLKLAYDAA